MSKMFEMLKLLRSNKGNQSNKRKLSGMSDRHRVRAEGVALCDRQGMRTEWYRAKHRMMWRCARG